VPATAQSGVAAIAGGYYYSAALKTNGSVMAWGYSFFGATTMPVTAQNGVTAIAARYEHIVALVGTGLVLPASLSLKKIGNELTLSWSTAAVGFKLQSTFDFGPPVSWNDSTNVPVVVGGQFTVTNTASGSNKFYRMKKPY
jgi:alpha-tubulin suppressor-like RCC1 family protein